ncbi:MAG: glutamine-hydrolyzing GMP synthase subunit GuaA [Methanomicrobia archaeon]|nr:glutamine-hydrolyzing GMP synthase subunit GuaA [Methanomicrobia archaeon]
MFDPDKYIEKKKDELKEIKGRAVVAASGGVDSTVCAFLAHTVVDDLKVVFIDDGLMREGEPEQVSSFFKERGLDITVVNAQKEFFDSLKGITDPEEKRKAFRNTFYTVLGRILKDFKAKYLIQGTIAADIKETKGGIKTQHNVLEQIGIDPKRYGLTIVEPLKDIYKHEVRAVGRALGLPEQLWNRIPFPGPGLACRVIGEVTPERTEVVRKATKITEEELLELKPFQTFAVLLNDKATGMKNGNRIFGNIIAVRCVESKDALTAFPTNVPWKKLEKLRDRILNEIPSVVKVVYDITPKPPSTIEYI